MNGTLHQNFRPYLMMKTNKEAILEVRGQARMNLTAMKVGQPFLLCYVHLPLVHLIKMTQEDGSLGPHSAWTRSLLLQDVN